MSTYQAFLHTFLDLDYVINKFTELLMVLFWKYRFCRIFYYNTWTKKAVLKGHQYQNHETTADKQSMFKDIV